MRMSWTGGTMLLASAVAVAACGDRGGAAQLELTELDSPAGPGSAQPNLTVGEGGVLLSWLEPVGDAEHVLRFSRLAETGWSSPLPIARGADFFVNWADFPSLLALPGGRLAAHWLVRSGPERFAYDVHIAQSSDGGASWGPSVVPHRDGTQTEHGFVSLFPWDGNRFGAIWLDGRDFADVAGEGHDGHGGAEMTLRFTTIGAAGDAEPETLLDGRVCECCQTAVATTAHGPVAVYRDRSGDEIRDIGIVRHVDGVWTAPTVVHEDGWRISGCPVNGPAIAADGERVAVAWFTAPAETPQVRLAFSDDAGASFGAPIGVDDGDPLGRVDLVLLDDGDALVVWLERTPEDAEIRMRRVSPSGDRHEARTVVATAAARGSGFPRLARLGDRLVFAWTEVGEPSRVRTAVATLR